MKGARLHFWTVSTDEKQTQLLWACLKMSFSDGGEQNRSWLDPMTSSHRIKSEAKCELTSVQVKLSLCDGRPLPVCSRHSLSCSSRSDFLFVVNVWWWNLESTRLIYTWEQKKKKKKRNDSQMLDYYFSCVDTWNIELNFFVCVDQQVRFIDTKMSTHLVKMKMKMKMHLHQV